MAKQADVEFRIRSRNLSSKSIKEVTKELDDLIATQERQRQVAAASSKTIEDLQGDYRKLAASLETVRGAQGAVRGLSKDEQAFREISARIRETVTELDRLRAGQAKLRGAGKAVPPDLASSIKKLEDTYTSLMGTARNLVGSISQQRKSLAEIGIEARDSTAALRALSEVEGTIVVAQTRTTQAINASSAALQKQEKAAKDAAAAEDRRQKELVESIRFEQERAQAARKAREADIRAAFDDADKAQVAQAEARLQREREITAEVQRRITAERQAASDRLADARRLAAEQQRIATRRADAIAAFSAAPAATFQTRTERQSQLAQDQIRARDAALRMAEINQRANAVEQRLAATRARLGTATSKLATDTERAGRASRLFADDTRKSLGFMQRARGQVLSLASAYVGLFGAINTVGDAFKAVSTQEGIEVKLRVANDNDAAKAAEDFKFLKTTADDLGVVFVDISKKFADYKIAAKSVGVSNELIQSSFTDVMKAISVNRLSQEDADGVLRAMIQIMSKARVQAEELRGQLGDRLPGAVAAFAKANNIALSDLDEKLKKGEVGVDFLLRGLQGYAQTVQKELPAATQSAQASLNRLKNAYNEFLITLGKSGVVDALKDVFVSLTEFFRSSEGQQAAKDLGEAFRTLGAFVKACIQHIDEIIVALKIVLALQVAKWFYGVGVAIKAMIGQLVLLRTAATAAAAQTGAMAVASRGLLALLGPVGVALAAAAGAFYLFDRAARQATERTEGFIDRMRRLRDAQGHANLGAIKAAKSDLDAKYKELQDLERRLEKAQKENPINQASAKLRAFTIGESKLDEWFGESPDVIRDKIKLVNQEIQGLNTGIQNARKEYTAFLTAEAQQPTVPTFSTGTEDDDEKAKDQTKLHERLAEQRLAIAHRTADALLDIEGDLAQARIEKEVVSLTQIDENLKQRLAVIDTEIAKKRADLEQMRAEAVKLNAPQAVASADKGLEQLATLQRVQQERAREQATVQSMQLLEKQLNDLIDARDAKLAHIATQQELHLIGQHEAQRQAHDVQMSAQDEIMAKIVALRDFIIANAGVLSQMMNVDEVIQKLDTLQVRTGQVSTASQQIAAQWEDQIASGMADTFAALGAGIADVISGAGDMSDAWDAAKETFRNFAADFLIQIGKMIIKTLILKAIEAMGGEGSGWGSLISSAASMAAGTNHTGGMVGSPRGSYRNVSPLVFANAPKYHSGGFPGLRADEVPIIAQRGEEVLTKTDPRNAMNGGGQKNVQVKVINAIDSSSVVSEAMNSRDGQTPVINMMKARRQEIRTLLGIG